MSPGTEYDGVDLLLRGWRPSQRLRTILFLSIGVVLILHPLVGGIPHALGLTGTVQYTTVEVQPESNQFVFSGPDRAAFRAEEALGGTGALHIDCYPNGLSEQCALESQLTEQNVTVQREPQGWRGYTYHEQFYKKVTAEENETIELGLEPVTPHAVLSNMSVPADKWPQPIQTAVQTGNVTVTEEPSFTGVVLSQNGSYYMVVSMGPFDSHEPPQGLAATVSTILGVLSIQYGRRQSLK
ncbi:hypothetical protein SAMN05216388_10575 [Halorientalis persicus]|uniref:Uncharacterized protein n=1 Tax=Halorientalis persicus TaxID=1367881 RepID=A0A1H8WF32_9EURY|nr:hypothetical protein SAMN05216388_10575 [Halorientalis persicus]